MEYITEESIKKIQGIIKTKPYICSDNFEKEVMNEMLDILRDDEKFQEFSNEVMNKIILGEL